MKDKNYGPDKPRIKRDDDPRWGIHILGGTLMIRIDRSTGNTWVFAKKEWHQIATSETPYHEVTEGLDKRRFA